MAKTCLKMGKKTNKKKPYCNLLSSVRIGKNCIRDFFRSDVPLSTKTLGKCFPVRASLLINEYLVYNIYLYNIVFVSMKHLKHCLVNISLSLN